jgi:hypothetical protein
MLNRMHTNRRSSKYEYPQADAYAPQYGAPQQVHCQLCAFTFTECG